MFTIDLKKSSEPVTALPAQVVDLQRLVQPFAPVIGVLAGLLIAFWAIDRRLDRSIEDQQTEIAGLEASLTESRQKLAEISGKTRVLYEGGRSEIYWSDGLRLLSETLPDKVWLTTVRATSPQTIKGEQGDVVTPGGLAVEGGVLSNANEGNLDVIGKFIHDLQADPRFSQSFSSITLESVQRSPDPYTLNFRLKLGFKA